nr:MAG TPA: hypothetical protein [Caudoviricetes sp.]
MTKSLTLVEQTLTNVDGLIFVYASRRRTIDQ